MLFSATQTRKVEDLARISLKKEPLYVGVDDDKDKATVDGLEQVGTREAQCWSLVKGAAGLKVLGSSPLCLPSSTCKASLSMGSRSYLFINYIEMYRSL